MIDFLDSRTVREEPTQEYIRANERGFDDTPDWPSFRVDKRQRMSDAAYMRYNMSRRAGKAEAVLEATYDSPLFRRVMGTFGINNPGISIIMGFKNGKCAAFLCIDRLPDNFKANLATGEGWEDGRPFVETMNTMSVLGEIPCYVIFSLDGWAPGAGHDDEIIWYEMPWPLARSLGYLDSRKTIDLRETVTWEQGSDLDDDEFDLDDDFDICDELFDEEPVRG